MTTDREAPRRTRRALPWALAAGCVLATLVPLVPFTAGVGLLRLPVLQSLPLVATAIAVAVTAVCAWRRHPASVVAALAAVGSLAPTVQWRPAQACTGPPVSVMSFNAFVSRADVDALSRAVVEKDVDVLVLVEANPGFLERFSRTPGGRVLAHRTQDVSSHPSVGSAILSRHPLTTVQGVRQGRAQMFFDHPAARIDVGGVPVTVQAVHPFPPTDGKVASWAATLDEIGRWQRSQDAEHLILAGDFNSGPGHPAFRKATSGLKSAGPTWGPFVAPTWPVGSVVPTFAPIDHVMVRGLGARASDTVRIPDADHLALHTDLTVCR